MRTCQNAGDPVKGSSSNTSEERNFSFERERQRIERMRGYPDLAHSLQDRVPAANNLRRAAEAGHLVESQLRCICVPESSG